MSVSSLILLLISKILILPPLFPVQLCMDECRPCLSVLMFTKFPVVILVILSLNMSCSAVFLEEPIWM